MSKHVVKKAVSVACSVAALLAVVAISAPAANAAPAKPACTVTGPHHCF
ncbi:hypothetical protein OG455_01915 [Kitasatospora sp. NBC_01287]|nr:hypothetical protein [Kitasatospora sp. NBC_01287]MCX4744280.1 hypothetical protein [Kitasatospora sp. NBC_01287]